MTHISIENENLIVTMEGADKLWALKSQLTIPLEHIAGVEHNPEIARGWYHGLKMPGSNIPGVLTAGTFYKDGEKVFWDVHKPENTIILSLHDENYSKLVIEVPDVMLAIQQITAAIPRYKER